MAIEDALQIIDQSWAEIEPRLTVRQLTTLAAVGPVLPERIAELSETVFTLLAPALPPGHPAWSALLSSRTRFMAGQQETSLEEIISRSIARARTAIADPSIADDAAADFLVDSMIRQIIRAGVVTGREFSGTAPLALESVGQFLYPLFQFAAIEPPIAHQIVGRLNEALGGDADPLGAIGWWLAPNAWLGRAPVELLGAGRDADIAYAASQLANDSW
jgi:hypothetical protein